MPIIEEKLEDNGTIYMDKIKVQVKDSQHKRRESEVVQVSERRQL